MKSILWLLYIWFTVVDGLVTLRINPKRDLNEIKGTDLAFVSIPEAKEYVRRKLRQGVDDDIIVKLDEGVYYLPSTLRFDKHDSNQKYPGRSVTWRGMGRGTVLSGGFEIPNSCFERQTDEPRVFRCSLNGTKIPSFQNTDYYFDEMFVNGMRMIRARFPNFDIENPLESGKGYTEAVDGVNSLHSSIWPGLASSAIIYNATTFSKKIWNNPSNNGTVFVFPSGGSSWGNLIYSLHSRNEKNSSLNFGDGGWQHNTGEFWYAAQIGKGATYYVEGIREELDNYGEWFSDIENGFIDFIPTYQLNVSTANIVISNLRQLLFIGDAKNLRFESMNFTHVGPTYLHPYHAPSKGDLAVHEGASVFITRSRNITIHKCIFDQVGGNGVYVSGENEHISILSSLFLQTGDSAILFVGDRYHTLGNRLKFPRNCLVSNCVFNGLGVYGKQVTAVTVSNANNVTISHNYAQNIPHSAFILNDGISGGHKILNNHAVNTVRETSDRGPVKVWGRERFWCYLWSHEDDHGSTPSGQPYMPAHGAGEITIDALIPVEISGNLFEHGPQQSGPFAIDIDDGSSNIVATNNIAIGAQLKYRDGDLRDYTNNIIVNSQFNPRLLMSGNSDKFKHNVFASNPSTWTVLEYNVDVIYPNDCDYNCIENGQSVELEGQYNSTTISKSDWQQSGNDKNSLFTDNVQYNYGNYSLSSSSPCFSVGFTAIPLQFGTIKRGNDEPNSVIPRPVRLTNCTNTTNQKWNLKPAKNGYLVISYQSGECISLPFASVQAYMNIELQTCGNSYGPQYWMFTNTSSASSQPTGYTQWVALVDYVEKIMCVDVYENSGYYYSLTSVCSSSSKSQLWYFNPSTLQIMNSYSNQCLEVVNFGLA